MTAPVLRPWCGTCLVWASLTGAAAAAPATDALEQDMARAAHAYREGCERQDPIACYYLALTYASGEGVKQDYTKGRGVAPDLRRAAERYKKACDAGSEQGCAGLRELEAGADGATPEK